MGTPRVAIRKQRGGWIAFLLIEALLLTTQAQAQICPNDPFCPRRLDSYRYPFQQHSGLNFDQVWRPPVITGEQIRRDWQDAARNPFAWDRGPATGVGTPQALSNPYGTGDPFHSPRLPLMIPGTSSRLGP